MNDSCRLHIGMYVAVKKGKTKVIPALVSVLVVYFFDVVMFLLFQTFVSILRSRLNK